MKIFIHNNYIFQAERLDGLNGWLQKQNRPIVENPLIQEVPNDCTIKDFANGIFSQTLYNERKQVEKEKRYERLVERYIRQKYSLNAELAILRQRNTKPDEFLLYHAYAEECKERAKMELSK